MFRARVALSVVVFGVNAVFAALIPTDAAYGQAPWKVEVTPATNPLAIGNCTWVYVTVKDAKGQTPRNSRGRLITQSHFDMGTAGVAVGVWDNPNLYGVCGCKGAKPGMVVTVTASYPAAALDPRERVDGVAFKSEVQFPLMKSYGQADAPACVKNAELIKATLSRPTSSSPPAPISTTKPPAPVTTLPPMTMATPASPSSPPAPVRTLPPMTTATPVSPSQPASVTILPPMTTATPVSPSSPAPVTIAPPMATATPVAPSSSGTPPDASVPGPTIAVSAPQSGGTLSTPVQTTGGSLDPTKTGGLFARKKGPDSLVAKVTPTGVHLQWQSLSNADVAGVAVYRKDGAALSTDRVSGTAKIEADYYGTGFDFDDIVSDGSLTYIYTIVNRYTDGSQAESAPVTVTFPIAVNPVGVVARDKGDGKVLLTWRSVPKAIKYRIDGTGLPNTGMLTADTAIELSKVPAGRGSWRLTSLMPLNVADYENATVANAIVRVLPPHALPWLSKANGVGSEAMAQLNATVACTSDTDPNRTSCLVGYAVPWLNIAPNTLLSSETGLMEAVYGNPADLGFGRRTSCSEGMQPAPGLLTTVCYASSHGVDPGAPGFADPVAMTRDAATRQNPRTWTVIVKDATGMRFMVYKPKAGYSGSPIDTQFSPDITLDSQGAKFAPHACLACHGGVYDTTTQRVQGASLQPIDPSQMSFNGGPAGRAAQEEAIRMINNYVLRSKPSAAIVAYITGLYGGSVAQVGARAIDDYVPSNWAAQTGFYKQVVRPYCATCHLAAQQSYSFSSWGNFQGNAALINVAVCAAHTMPHAEIPYKAFWTKDTGSLYLPGLLASTLGFPSC